MSGELARLLGYWTADLCDREGRSLVVRIDLHADGTITWVGRCGSRVFLNARGRYVLGCGVLTWASDEGCGKQAEVRWLDRDHFVLVNEQMEFPFTRVQETAPASPTVAGR